MWIGLKCDVLRREPARYYVLRNVLVRQGEIVLFVPPAADAARPPDGPSRYYFFKPGRGHYVNISYGQRHSAEQTRLQRASIPAKAPSACIGPACLLIMPACPYCTLVP